MATTPKFESLKGKTYPETPDAQLDALKTDEQLQELRESREKLASDPYRPLYHFSPPENRLNDPNGLCQWRGKYHLCYQFVPKGQDRLHWGHTVSDDLVHWEDLPIALYPTTERDCYSGQTVVEEDRVVAIYHGTESGNSIATASDPLLLNWKKHPANPVIPNTPDEEPYRVFDPCIWKEEDGYYALSGTYKDGEFGINCRGIDHLFRSKNLAMWEYLGPLLEDGFYSEPGEDGAVPNFWPIGNGKYMLLLFSHKRAGRYYVGDYDKKTHKFTPDYHGRMNYGVIGRGSLHAPSATIDDKGRFLAIFNLTENKTINGWNGMMSLPRHLSLNPDNSLRIESVPELESLRYDHRSVGGMNIAANSETVLHGIKGKAMEIEAVIHPGSTREVGLNILRSPNGEEQTTITLYRNIAYYVENGISQLAIDVSRASLRQDVGSRPPEIGPLILPADEPLTLRMFIDRSSIEIFANGKQCLTIRAYPERDDSNGVSIFARGGDAKLVSFDTWQMRSIWPELKHYEGK